MDESKKKPESSAEHREPAAKEHKVRVKTTAEDTVPRKDYDALREALETAQKSGAANLEGWQRERAEFSNYKKRIDREHTQLTQSITGSVIKKYLVILDDLDLALKARPTEGEGAAWAAGVELVARKLTSILEGEGIERINENNVPFDPNIHEAISNEDNPDVESGHVIEVVRQGFKLGDRILRPAMVRVAR
jgi:molecular chaperone GrpE